MIKLSTDLIHSLLNTPKKTLITLLNLTGLLRCYRLKRAAIAVSSQGRKQLMGAVYVLAAITSITSIPEATATSYSKDHLKLYAHSRIINYKEFQCFNRLITLESSWNYNSQNGSHYGLGQMKSKHYRDLDPFRQIDASLAYITKRYSSNCKALAFHNKKGYY
jgi:hypothetical protein